MVFKNDPPPINPANKPQFPQPEKLNLSSGISVYGLKVGKQDLVRIDFIFDAGSVYAENPLLAEAVNTLSDSSTILHTSEMIAEELDFYGAYLEKYSGFHKSKIVLYTLNKYIDQTLCILSEIIYQAIFPVNEIDVFIQNRYQNYLINRKKTEIISNELFTRCLFGPTHPYGKNPTDEDFKLINREMITQFHKKHYMEAKFKIIISGKVESFHYDLIEKYFGKTVFIETQKPEIDFMIEPAKTLKHFECIENTVQSSVKIGKRTINKKHPDFFNLNITTVLLGGYFGSRLMKNIREDKGYTYGIYASNTSLIESGFFSVSAETGKHVYSKAIDEIYKELKSLRTKKVPVEELARVKNWISGNMLKAFDGPFALLETLSSTLDYDMDFGYYERYFEAIKSITPDLIIESAETYLHEDAMYEIVAGSK
jgi:predicted Zn-dependent peptidase